jgi:hypothetical protein
MAVTIDGTNGITFNNSSTQAQSAGLGSSATAQTWQNMTASRALGTTYTNSTGYPIMVIVSGNGSGGNLNALLVPVVGGVSLATSGSNSGTAGGTAYASVSFIVPNGATYTANNGGGATLERWFELR